MRSTIHLLRGLQCGIRHFQIIGMRVLTAIAIMHQSRARSRSRAKIAPASLRSRSSFEDAPFDVTPFADAIVGDATGSLCFATSIAPVGQDFTTYVYGPRGHFVADFTGSSADTLHPKALPQPSGFQMLQEITPVFARLDVYTADGTLIRESPVKEADSLVSSVDPLRGHTHPLEAALSNMRTLDYARPGPSPEGRDAADGGYLDAAPLAGGGAAIGATLAGSLPAVYHSIAKLRVGDISQIDPGWLTPFLWTRVAIVRHGLANAVMDGAPHLANRENGCAPEVVVNLTSTEGTTCGSVSLPIRSTPSYLA